MNVEVITLFEYAVEERDYRDALVIKVDNSKRMEFYDGEPEDATLSRNFSDCHRIVEAMEDAYNAGKNGEELEIIYKEVEEI
ncbi:hypothetical protein ABFP60_01940 [Clostridioides difficile]